MGKRYRVVDGVPDDHMAAWRKLVGPEAWDQWAGARAHPIWAPWGSIGV